jgi:hypothetical protein
MQPPEMRRLKRLEDENSKLKKIAADLSRDAPGCHPPKCMVCPACASFGTIRRRQFA